MGKHTTGPWKAVGRYVEAGNGALVCNTIEMRMKNEIEQERESYKSRANARLIAAAPDMLNALEECADVFESGAPDFAGILKTVRGVITKAREE